jgi:GntR family transcriptional regulator
VPSSVLLGSRVRDATLDEADDLRIAPGTELFEFERQRLLDGVVVAIDSVRVPTARAPWIVDVDFATASLHATLQEHGAGPARGDSVIEVLPASAAEATLLAVDAGQALLVVTTIAYDSDELPISSDRISYRPDRYRLRTSLTRPV